MKEKKQETFKVKGKTVSVKKKSYVGTVVSTKMAKTVTVEWDRFIYIPKYERFLKRRTKVHAHVPEFIKVEEGDKVKIFATRPLSKTVNFAVMENLGKEKHYAIKKEAQQESKTLKQTEDAKLEEKKKKELKETKDQEEKEETQ